MYMFKKFIIPKLETSSSCTYSGSLPFCNQNHQPIQCYLSSCTFSRSSPFHNQEQKKSGFAISKSESIYPSWLKCILHTLHSTLKCLYPHCVMFFQLAWCWWYVPFFTMITFPTPVFSNVYIMKYILHSLYWYELFCVCPPYHKSQNVFYKRCNH